MIAKVLFPIVLLGLLFFVGCTVGETAVSPTATAVLIVESVDTPIPSPTPTATLAPSATSQPSATTTFTPSPTVTNTRTPIPTNTATPTPTATSSIRIVTTSVSPQGNWIAETLQGYFEGSEEESSLIHVSSNEQKWIADTPTEGYGLVGILPPVPLSWSNDEKFFFFTYRAGGDGCFPSGNGAGVFRLNLITGEVEEIPTDSGYWYAPSADGLHLAYTFRESNQLQGIRLFDMESSIQQEIQLDFQSLHENVTLAYVVWSPDNNALLVIAVVDLCFTFEPTFSLIHIDLETGKQTTLIDEHEGLHQIVEWPDADRALLELIDRRIMWVNTLTGELTPAEE